ncbi:retrovirus-related pol polyprotein from transposon TNT 1-94 [Tanacetum coccineum]
MEMWLGHPSDYGMLRIFGCDAYPHGKQGKLEPRAVKYVLLRNVVFNESLMYKDTLKNSGAGDKSVEELQVEVELQRLNNHTPEEDQKDSDDEDAEGQETDQPPYLTDYQLVRDREPRTRTKPLRFRDESNMVAYAFVAAEEEDNHEPLTYQEAVACETIKEGIQGVQKPGYKARLVARRFTQRADDMLIACKSKAEIGSTKSLLKKEFYMKELGEAKKILGMEIVRDRSRKILRVSQSWYVSKILNTFRIDNGKSVKMPLGRHFKLSLKDCPVRDCDVEMMSKVPYANAVGSLMYMMVCTSPGTACAISVVSRYLANPSKNHWEEVKWILKYLRGTANVGLVYGTNRSNHVDVTGVWKKFWCQPMPLNSGAIAILVPNTILLTWHHFFSITREVWHDRSPCSKYHILYWREIHFGGKICFGGKFYFGDINT